MRKHSLALVTILMAIIGFTSCSQDGEINNIASESKAISNKVTVEEAKANVLDFINNLNKSNTRAFPTKSISIANVKPISIKAGTRTGASVNTDTLFYIVNFEDSCGFAIASASKNDTPILALVEDGNYEYNETDTLNPGFEAFMDAMIDREIDNRRENFTVMPKDDLTEGGGSSSNYRPNKFEVMSPLLKTKWNQNNPYNTYCSNCPTGCVITAVSQICSYLQSPKNISYQYNSEFGQATMNWEKINQECSINGGEPLFPDTWEQVERMMRFWGVSFGANYSDGGTSVDTGDAVKKMRDNFGFNVTGLSDYNIDNVIKDLKCGNKIILMRGNGRYYHVGFFFRKYVDGHAWVVDGYIDQVKNNQENKYVHCNWGWGQLGNNGYFLSNVLNAEETPVYDDDVTSSTRSNNFRYKLKTATFTK